MIFFGASSVDDLRDCVAQVRVCGLALRGNDALRWQREGGGVCVWLSGGSTIVAAAFVAAAADAVGGGIRFCS